MEHPKDTGMGNNIRILVVDDEETLCEGLRFSLEAEGYTVDVAYSAEQALTLDLKDYDIFILDIMMGEISGIQLARILKATPATAKIPVIFCTAKDSEEDMIRGLDLGADDYITKPYSLKTVSARIRTVLRRVYDAGRVNLSEHKEVKYQGLIMDPGKKLCMADGEDAKLTKKEFEILLLFLSHFGYIFSRREILDSVWPDEVVVLDRVVDVNITHIRQKIGKYGKNIVTRSGYGYGFVD